MSAPTTSDGGLTGILKREPAAIIGVVVAVITSIIAAAGDGGWQWDPDGWVVLSQLATALGIRQIVFSPHSVEERIRIERLATEESAATRKKPPSPGPRSGGYESSRGIR